MKPTILEPVPEPAAMLDVDGLGDLLRCSPRSVRRLADAGRLPPPVKLGALVRWRRAEIDEWLAAGCPPVRVAKGGRQ